MLTTEYIQPMTSINSSDSITYLDGPTVELVEWATKVGGNSVEFPVNLQLDSHNNVYVSGRSFSPLIELYNGQGPSGSIIPLSTTIGMTGDGSGDEDIYIVKYREDGTIVWATKIGGSSNDEVPVNLQLDSHNNVYVSGRSNSTLIELYNGQGPSGSIIPLDTAIGMIGDSSSDNYIVKYREDGTIEWATKVGSETGSEVPINLQLDLHNNVYVSGRSTSSLIELYNGQGPSGSIIPLGSFIGMTGDSSNITGDNYIVKYREDGTIVWATKIGGSSTERPVNLQLDSHNNVYVSGRSFSPLIELYNGQGPTGGIIPLGTAIGMTGDGSGDEDNYIVKYREDGSIEWATKVGGSSDEEPVNLQLDSHNNVYVSGYSESSLIELYNGQGPSGGVIPLGTAIDMTGHVSGENYIVKYREDGSISWATKVGGETGNEQPVNLQLDSHNNVYVSGFSESSLIELYNGQGPSGSVIPLGSSIGMTGDSDVSRYIIKYNEEGSIKWATKVFNEDRVIGIKMKLQLDSHNNVYVSGMSTSPLIELYNGRGPSGGVIPLDPIPIGMTGDSSGENYIVKYREDGSLSWAAKVGGETGYEQPVNLQLDSHNNVYVSGASASPLIELYSGQGPSGGIIPLGPFIGMTGDSFGLDNYIVKFRPIVDHYELNSVSNNIKYIYNLSDNDFEIDTNQNLKLKGAVQSSVTGVVGSSLTLTPTLTTWVVMNDNDVEYVS
jgi:hypothetical protein